MPAINELSDTKRIESRTVSSQGKPCSSFAREPSGMGAEHAALFPALPISAAYKRPTARRALALELAARLAALALFVACSLLWLKAAVATRNGIAWLMFTATVIAAAVCTSRFMGLLMNGETYTHRSSAGD